jgi:hypothetical protein
MVSLPKIIKSFLDEFSFAYFGLASHVEDVSSVFLAIFFHFDHFFHELVKMEFWKILKLTFLLQFVIDVDAAMELIDVRLC